MNTEETIDVLNTLIEINNDRIAGYETARNETEDADLKILFSQFIQTSVKNKAELSKEVIQLGGTPTDETRTDGKIFRVWMDFKAAVTGHSRKAIINSCEFGEDAALETYTEVLSRDAEEITAAHRAMIQAQHANIIADHDKVKGLRDMMLEHK